MTYAQYPGLSEAAEKLLARRLSAGGDAALPLRSRPAIQRAERPALSFGQRRLWFLDKLYPGNSAYNVSTAYRIQGRLDIDALGRALTFIVGRHEILRTRYVAQAGEPYQVIEPASTLVMRVVDFTGESDPLARADSLVLDVATAPFDLAEGPVIRAALMRLAAQDHVLALAVHHIAFDRESLVIMAAEISEAYAAYLAGRTPSLPPIDWQYADMAAWQRAELAGAALDEPLGYWRQRLRGAPPAVPLPADYTRPPVPSYRADVVAISAPSQASEAIRELAARHGLTIFALTMAAFAVLLARHSGATDIVVGCGINTRPRSRSEHMIGFFTNSLPIRATASGDPRFLEFARQIADAVLDAHEHQDLPFDIMVERLCPERDLSRYPIIQLWFDCVSLRSAQDIGLPKLAGASLTQYPIERADSRFDLELHLSEEPGASITGRLIYATDLFDRATAESMASHYVNLLGSLAADPGRRLSALDMLDADELSLILHRWGVSSDSRR